MKGTSRFAAKAIRQSAMWGLFGLLLLSGGSASAQTPAYQRIIPRSVAEVQKLLETIRPVASGRLPTLEGFVQPQDQPLEQFKQGYYECTFQVAPAVGGGTMVQAAAKVTAWYTDPAPDRSGYRVLISNGRLENDFLDRISEALVPSAPSAAPAAPQPSATAPAAPSADVGGLHPAFRLNSTTVAPAESSSLDSSSLGTPRAPPRLAPASPLPAGESLESLKARHEADEKQTAELTAYVKNMEEILHNQSRPADLVAVKRAKTPIFSKPLEGSQILLTADSQDEFELLGVEGSWVHLQISGPARGWVRRSEVEMPPGYAQSTGGSDANPPGSAAIFKVSKEETSPFTGSWEPLKGKIVRIEWVEPLSTSSPSSATEKLSFAKSIFLRAYETLDAAHPTVEGIVIVFDSADGGQIAAAIPTVKGLAGGTLSETVFWRQCSLDPSESFQVSAKR